MAAWTVPRLLVLVQLLLLSGDVVSVRAQVNKSIRSSKVIEDTIVYRYPTERSEQIASIPSGTTVHVVSPQFGNWARIQSEQGRPSGYIKKSSLAITESGSSESTEMPKEFRRNPQSPSLRSKESRVRTEIELNNRLSTPVAIYWVDFQGNEIFFEDLNPGATKVLQTFASHAWLVRDKRTGQVLRTSVAGSARELVIIDKVPSTSQSASREPQRSPSVAQQPPSKKSREVCTGDSIQLNQNETVSVTFKSGCRIHSISLTRGDLEEVALWPSGRTTKLIRKQSDVDHTYPEWPPSVISFKAITPSTITFLAENVRPPPKSLKPQIQAQPQMQPKPSLPSRPIAVGSSPMSTMGNFLTMAFSVIVGCGVIYAIILAVKTPSPFVKGNWSTLIENFQASPKEFYVSVEKAIASRQVPDINKSRVDWKEGGLLTAFREYLRISREKLVLDICAAPYGTGFFVSWWLAELRPSALGPSLAVIGLAVYLFQLFGSFFGLATGAFLTLCGLILIVLLLGILVNRSSGANWVRYVLVIPLIGKMIERFFMPPTYYRMDTEAMFKASIEQSVKEALNQMLQAKGMRALTDLELKPIMRDFFQR